MTEGQKRFLAILVVIAGLVVFYLLLNALKTGGQRAGAEEIPTLSFTDIQGNTINLEDYRGKVLLVNNFAVWCPPCRQEMPELEAYYKEHKAEGFEILAIEAGQPADQVAEFLANQSLTFPVVLDPEMKSVKAFRNTALPNSLVIDRQWKVRTAWVGSVDKAYLEKNITPILEE